MLPRSRVVSVMLLGLSATLLVLGAMLPRYLHADNRIPLTLSHTTMALRADHAIVGDYRGPAVKQFHVELMDPVDERAVTLRVGATLRREGVGSDLDRLVSAKVWNFRMDRGTGEVLGQASLSDQLVGPVREVPIDGLWVKFPAKVQQQTYQVFDDTLRQARPAVFVGDQERDGRTIMMFRQEIEPTNLATLFADPAHTTVFEEEDGATTPGYLFHAATRDWLVDKETGMVIEVHEIIDDFYGTIDGAKREQVLSFNGGGPSPDASAELLAQAASIADDGWVEIVPWVLCGVGGVLAIVGLVGIFGVGARRGAQQ